MFEDRDFPLEIAFKHRRGYTVDGPRLAPGTDDLVQDLELATVLEAMAAGDGLLLELARRGLLTSLSDPAEIAYRQEVVTDCLEHPDLARGIYAIATEAMVQEQQVYRPRYGNAPSAMLRGAIETLELFIELLRRLRGLADDHLGSVRSRAMTSLLSMLRQELDEEYFADLAVHLERLRFRSGTLISARLGRQNRGVDYVLRSPSATERSLRERMGRTLRERIGTAPPEVLYFDVPPRDEAGTRMLTELNDRGVNLVANALAQSTEHILSFFTVLCAEVGFYVGCCNLHDRLEAKGRPTCRPEAVGAGDVALTYRGLYDVALALRSDGPVIGNDAVADGKALVMITGANSGGKSTLLRALGQAQLMLQAGMPVGATSFGASVCEGLFTHFIREEDEKLSSGKLDEELARMSAIVERLGPHSIVMLNESFAATNEREGSEIARQIVDALLEAGVRVRFVTHQFTLAQTYFARRSERALFLRAARGDDGRRSFKVEEGEPWATSFGEDVYRRIGGFPRIGTMRPPGEAGGVPDSGQHARGVRVQGPYGLT